MNNIAIFVVRHYTVHSKLSPSHSHWLPPTISIRRPQYSLFAPICPCSAPSSSSVPSDRTIPPTRPSPQTQALASSGTPCSPASELWSPPTSSMASRNPTHTASPSSGCTRTLLPPPSPPSPQTGCWESARLRSLPLSGTSPGHTARPSPNSALVSRQPWETTGTA